MAVAALGLFYDVFPKLLSDWWNDENYSHGLIIPFVIGYLYWLRRDRIRQIPSEPSPWGWAVFLSGLIIYIAGRFGAEYYLTRISLLILLSGIILAFHGTRMMRFFLPGVILLLLAIPLPYIVYNQIAFPLKLFASRLSGEVLDVVGVPVFREGNVIHLPTLTLYVEDACSGLRSLMAFLTIGAIVCMISSLGKMWRIFFLFMTVIVAIIANVIRIVGTGILAGYFDPKFAEGFYHAFSGWVIFVIGLGLLALLHKMIPQGKY